MATRDLVLRQDTGTCDTTRQPITGTPDGTKSLRDDLSWAAAVPAAHAASHQNGGTDEISVAGLSGLLADAQTPLTHSMASHTDEGALATLNTVGTTQIDNAAVTLAKMEDITSPSFIGRTSGIGTGVPQNLTSTQAAAILPAFTGDSGAGGVKGLVPAPAAGDAAAGKYLKADGNWTAPGTGSQAAIQFKDEGGNLAASGTATEVNFTGAGVTASAAGTVITVNVPGGAGEAFPTGSVFLSVVSTNPGTLLGYGTWSAIGAGRVLVGLDSGDTDFDVVEETGGAKTVASAGTNAAEASHTHQVTSNVSVAAHTPTQPTIAWPVGVPTAANESSHTHAAGAISWPAGVPTHSGTAVSDHAAHTHTAGAISWPAGVPTYTGAIGTLAVTAHTIVASKQGTAAGNVVTTATHTITGAPGGTIAWPAGVPTGAASGNPNATMTHTVSNQGTIAWPAGVPTSADTAAGSSHTHAISWPVGVPTASGGGVDAHGVTNTPVTSASGSSHNHAFTGSATSVVQPYFVVYMWKRTA